MNIQVNLYPGKQGLLSSLFLMAIARPEIQGNFPKNHHKCSSVARIKDSNYKF